MIRPDYLFLIRPCFKYVYCILYNFEVSYDVTDICGGGLVE